MVSSLGLSLWIGARVSPAPSLLCALLLDIAPRPAFLRYSVANVFAYVLFEVIKMLCHLLTTNVEFFPKGQFDMTSDDAEFGYFS